ncbi:dUTP diphosphatase [Pseudokineococcus sp. 5B2Z-1]|uniref:dUTP diphosphatase n=1 Tax=Pseudokineococcus sp. 5B2Z-1 TaxID=3132744 RepID=UPI0030A05F60
MEAIPSSAAGAAPSEAAEVVPVALRRLDADLPLPVYAHPGDAGADLVARHDAHLPPGGGRATVATGVALALPEGYAAFVHPRSGLAARHGVTTLNAPGTVDAGYRGEVLVTLVNTDRAEPFDVRRGDRIAQLVVQRVARAELRVVDELPPSGRGAGGHGSTGGWGSGGGTGPEGGAAADGALGGASATLGGRDGGTGAAAGAADPPTAGAARPAAQGTTRTTTRTSGPGASSGADPTETTAGGPRAAGEEQP